MKKKKPDPPANPAYLAGSRHVTKTSLGKDWYSQLLDQARSLRRLDVVVLSVIAFLLALYIWQPPLQVSTLQTLAIILFFGAAIALGVPWLINLFMESTESDAITRRVIQDRVTEDRSPEFRWIESNGGPLLLLSQNLLSDWEGADPPTKGRTVEAIFRWQGFGAQATDYDRACDVEDNLRLINVGGEQGLVLGGKPMPTAWWPTYRAQSGGLLVLKNCHASDKAIAHAISQIPNYAWVSTEKILKVGNEPLYLFDSAYTGADLKRHLEIRLAAGRYSIATCEYEPESAISLMLHCFYPASD